MISPWFKEAAVAVSGVARSPGSLPLINARTVAITYRVKFNASHAGDATGAILYSPDGNNWDTIALKSTTITTNAGEYVQVTNTFDVPESGFIACTVTNNDAGHGMTDLSVWMSIHSYAERGVQGRGDIRKDLGE